MSISPDEEIDMTAYRSHRLIDESDRTVDDSMQPLLSKREIRSRVDEDSGGFFSTIKRSILSIFKELDTDRSNTDMTKCRVCGDKMHAVIEGVPYCRTYADIYSGRKNKSMPVSCRYEGSCYYPECSTVGTRFLEDSMYVTEGYYCRRHLRRIDMMIQQEMTVQYMLKRSEEVKVYTGDQPEYFKD